MTLSFIPDLYLTFPVRLDDTLLKTVSSEEEAFAELNIVSEDDKVEIEESGSLEISNTDAVSDEDLEDAAIFFDFFDDGGVEL